MAQVISGQAPLFQESALFCSADSPERFSFGHPCGEPASSGWPLSEAGEACQKKTLKLGTPTLAGRARQRDPGGISLRPALPATRFFSACALYGAFIFLDGRREDPAALAAPAGNFLTGSIGADREAAMKQQQGFIRQVEARGGYPSGQAASTAVNSVFGAIKCQVSASASEALRRALPRDASQLWAGAPLAFRAGRRYTGKSAARSREDAAAAAFRHFVLRVQQVGRYKPTLEAQRAVNSVLAVLSGELPGESGRFLWRMFPPELIEVWRARKGWAA